MRAATAGTPGRRGLVPMPPAGSQTKFLRGDGTFQAIAGGGDMLAANNLGDVASAATARTNLGLGTGDSPTFAGQFITGNMVVGASTAPGIPSAPRAIFTHTTTAAGAPTIAVAGAPGGYGAGIDFVSALGDAITTFKPLAKIVSDGTSPWNSTAATQDANLTIWTSVDGSLVKSATFDGASVAIASTSAIKGVRTATATTNFGDLTAGSTAFVDIPVTGASATYYDSTIVNCKDISNSFPEVSLTAFVVADNSVRIVARNNGATTATAVTGISRVTVTSF